MFVAMFTSVFSAVAVTLALTSLALTSRGQNRIMRRRFRTADDAAALLAGLPTDELRDLDTRIHAWIEQDEMQDFLTGMSDEEAAAFIARMQRLPRRGQL